MDHPKKRLLSPSRMAMRRAAQILYALEAAAGVLTIAMIVVLEPTPNVAPGWCWIVLGLVCVFAAITGLAGFQSDACFVIHYGIQALSLLGYGASTVALFVSRPAILRGINQRQWPEDRVDNFLRGVRWAFLATFGIHVVALVLACVAHRCVPVYVYETLEEQAQRRQQELGKIQKEVEAQKAKQQEGEASKLAKKMREKYGKWTLNENFGEMA